MGNLKKGRLREIYIPIIFFFLVFAVGVIAAQVGPKNLFVAVTTGNTNPIVFNASVALNGTVSLTDSGRTEFTVGFNVSDADGTANINDAKVGVNITFNGVKRSNNSGNCLVGAASSTVSAYRCIVVFNYFDNSSTLWEINLSAEDDAGSKVHNDSQSPGSPSAGHNVTTSSLSAFTLQTPSIVATANLGSTNNEMTIVVNNTGNFDFTLINVTPFDLNTSLTDFFKLGYNFSINATPSSSGFGENLTNATPRNFTASDDGLGGQLSATLPHKITSGEADNLGNRTLYIYVDVPSDKGLSSGVTYNSSRAWELFTS